MLAFKNYGDVNVLCLIDVSGKGDTFHIETNDPKRPYFDGLFATRVGNAVAVNCDQIVRLAQPTKDGAKSIIKFSCTSPFGAERRWVRKLENRCAESSEEILAAFENAGMKTCPPVVDQLTLSKAIEKIGQYFVHPLTHA